MSDAAVVATETPLSGDPQQDREYLFKAVEKQGLGHTDEAEQMFRHYLAR